MNKPTKYVVIREFTGGLLKGLTHMALTTKPPKVGFRCDKPLGGSPYVVTKVYLAAGSNS